VRLDGWRGDCDLDRGLDLDISDCFLSAYASLMIVKIIYELNIIWLRMNSNVSR
jgi:hypothetical protein